MYYNNFSSIFFCFYFYSLCFQKSLVLISLFSYNWLFQFLPCWRGDYLNGSCWVCVRCMHTMSTKYVSYKLCDRNTILYTELSVPSIWILNILLLKNNMQFIINKLWYKRTKSKIISMHCECVYMEYKNSRKYTSK